MPRNREPEPVGAYTAALIDNKSRELARKPGFTQSDLPDIRQEMRVELLERSSRFDPGKAGFKTFAALVVGRKMSRMLRHRLCARRDARRERFSLDEPARPGGRPRIEALSRQEADARSGACPLAETERVCLRLDLEAALARLSPELRDVALRLRSDSASDVARALGIPQRTFRENHLARLRAAFTEAGLENFFS